MTTPGAVANSVSAPSKTPVGSRQGGSGKGESSASKEGFGDVLSGLEKTDESPDKTSTAKSDTRSGARSGGREGMPRGDLGMQLQAADAGTRTEVAPDPLSLLQDDLQLTADTQPDANPAPPAAATGTTAADGVQASMAVIAALNAASQGSVAAPSSTDTTIDDAPQPTVDATANEGAESGTAKRPAHSVVAMADTAAESAAAETNTARGVDPNIARVAAASNGAKEKPAQSKKSDLADAPATAAADMPADLESDESINLVRHTRANVVRQEVHFAPVTEPLLVADGAEQGAPLVDGPQLDLGELGSGNMRPAQQLAQRIVSEAASEPAFARQLAGADQPVGKPALKILQIQLQPADLGTVTVRMEMKDADLVLHVEADRAATAEMLRSDQDSLSKLLRASGYNIDSGSIRVVEGDRGAAAQQHGQQGGGQPNLQSQAQSHSGASHRDDGAQQRGNSQTTGGDAQQARRNETHGTTTQRTGSGLYL